MCVCVRAHVYSLKFHCVRVNAMRRGKHWKSGMWLGNVEDIQQHLSPGNGAGIGTRGHRAFSKQLVRLTIEPSQQPQLLLMMMWDTKHFCGLGYLWLSWK